MERKVLEDVRKAKGRPGRRPSVELQRNSLQMEQAVRTISIEDSLQRNSLSMRQAVRTIPDDESLQRNSLPMRQAVSTIPADELLQRNSLSMSQAVNSIPDEDWLRNSLSMSQAVRTIPDDELAPLQQNAPPQQLSVKTKTKAKSLPAKPLQANIPNAPPPPPPPKSKSKKRLLPNTENTEQISPYLALKPMNLDEDQISYESEDEDEDMYLTENVNKRFSSMPVQKITTKKSKKTIKALPPHPSSPLQKSKARGKTSNYVSNILDPFVNTQQQEKLIVTPKITSDMLTSGLKKLKSIKYRQDEEVKVNSEKTISLFDKRDYFPLCNFIEAINQNTKFGDSERITNLSLNGIEQVTDLLFYHMMTHIIELPSLSIINFSGCHNLTDAGIKWCILQFPYLSEVYLRGCKNLTERTIHYLMDDPYNVLEHLDMTSNNVSIAPGKFSKQTGMMSLSGCPLISPSTEIYQTKKRSALLDKEVAKQGSEGGVGFQEGMGTYNVVMWDNKGGKNVKDVQLKDLLCYKVVVLKDSGCPHSFIEMATKKPQSGRYLNIYPGFEVGGIQFQYNIFEAEFGMGMENLMLSNGGIIILAYSSIEQDTVEKLTKKIVYLLTKCPESVFVIADMSDTKGNTSASISREVVSNLEAWSEKFGAEHTAPLGDLYMDFTFVQQKNFVKALSLLDSIHLIQKNKESTYKLILDVDMSGGKSNTDTLKFLQKAVNSLRNHFPWHGNIYHPQTVDWFNKEYTKDKLRFGKLTEIMAKTSESIQFNISSREVPYKELDKLFILRHQRGKSMYYPNMKNKPGFLDLSTASDFYNKTGDKLPKSSMKASIAGLGMDYPCFTEQDLVNTTGSKEENDIFFQVMVENRTLLKLPLSQRHASIKESTVYVVTENLPDKPHIPVEHFWDGKFEDQLYSGRKYRIPVLPDSLLVSVIRHFVKVAKICLIWKNGVILQQGPVTYMMEIFRKGDYPGVLLEGRLHTKSKPGDETYLEADRMVWKGLRAITSIFENVLLKDEVYFSAEYFFYEEKKKFDRNEALEWFAGVREKPYMCDSVQKLVPNHAIFEEEEGTRCYQCDSCIVNGMACPENLSNYRFRNECGCKEYAPLCKTCGMCKTCIHEISQAVSTIQPSFRMARETAIDNLTITGSIMSFSTRNLEYIFRSDMSYDSFSHLRIALVIGINYKLELTNFSDGQITEIVRYETHRGRIEVVTVSSSNQQEQIKDTIKKRGFDCHTGYVVELRLTNNETMEIHKNGEILYTWELSGQRVQVSLTSLDPGNVMISSDHYVDFQDRSSETEKGCCELSLPSCVERKFTRDFQVSKRMLFGDGVRFSGAAACILPEQVTESQLQYPTAQILSNSRVLMPLCLTKNRFTEDWNLANVAHMVNSGGLALTESEKAVTTVGLACNSVMAHYPYINIPDKFEKYLRNAGSKLETGVIEKGMQEIIRYIGMDLVLEHGLENSLSAQLPAQLRKALLNFMEPFILDTDKSGVYSTESIFESGRILYLCEGHKAAYQSRSDFTVLSPNEFGGYARFIRDIKIVKTALVTIPEDMFLSMPFLIRIELYENLLEKFPESVGNCKLLQALDLADNNLTDLPQGLANCQQLFRLDIGRNTMEYVPPVVTKLKLKRLLLNNMLLTSLPEDIGNIETLEMLYANGNCFTKLPKSICKLKNLEDLSLGGVTWIEIRDSTFYTRQMFEDFLQSTRIGQWLDAHNEDKDALFHNFDLDANNVLDSKEIGNINATMFNIFPRFGYKGKEPPDDDHPSGFPPEIFELTKLRYLNLQYQGIVHIPEDIGKLTNLETLVLGNNPNLLSVAGQCGMLPLRRLELSNCGLLKTPPKEIRERGFHTVYAYLRRLMTGSVECKRTKLMFVGLGGAGKTSLAKALMTNEFQTSLTGAQAITDGIDICTWTVNQEGEKVQYSVWDFAGQTVYYNTHQFFLSDRAVYLLLWNVRLGQEHAGLNFWLSSISVHASKAPIFIVGTHMDQVPKAELPIEEMMAAYPQIEGFFFVSSYTGQGIEELKSDLLKVTLRQDYMGEKIPAAYLDLENIIMKKRQDKVHLVEYTEVERMANNAGIVEKEEVAQAVQFLHDLGSVQHFSNEVLKSKVVINPQWIVDVMARVVSVKESPIEEGKLKHEDIKKVWKEYPVGLHYWLLQLTEEYDLTFKLANEKVNLVPCLLPEKKPEIPWPEIKKESNSKETIMSYTFEYLPAGLFNRAQVRLQEFSDSAIIWKRGSFLRKNEHIALLQQHKDREMTVKVQGPRPENILFLVHEVFEALINESFHGVKYDFSVPCPDCNVMMKRDPHMFTASMIRRAIDLQAPFLQCLKYFHTISVGDLQSTMPPDTTQDYDIHLAHAVNDLQEFDKGKTLDLFISYCELDAPKDKSKVIHPEDVQKQLLKEDYKCFFPDYSKKSSMDFVAKSLIDSSIFVAFISNNYVNDPDCCNLFKFAKTTLRKPFIIVAVGPDHEWKKSALGLVVSDVVFINMIDSKKPVFDSKMQELLDKIKEIYSVEVSNESPPCFVSYCWKNSKDAVDLGTKAEPQSYAYTPDPRDIAGFLTASGVPCWLDTKRIGFGMSGLLDDIAKGLLNSQMMVAFVSDDYSASSNSMTELSFAALTLQIPIIIAVVGQGDNWKRSEVNLLAFRYRYPMIDFRQLSENEGKEELLTLAKGYLKDIQSEDSSSVEQEKNKKPSKKDKQDSSNKKDNLSFQELYELAQRKFHHQIMQYAITQDTGLPYPRLFVVDILKEKDKKDEKSAEEKKSLEELGISYRDGQYCVHILCECESGWHTVSEPIPLEEDFGASSLAYYTPYLSRITALMKHNTHMKMNAESDRHGVAFLRHLTESSAIELTDCKTEYHKLREKVMELDPERKMGGLSRCRLPSGKMIWLCEEHISKMKVTVLTNEMIAHDKTTTGVVGTDYMLESLREMELSKMKLSFKSAKKAKRLRTAPKDVKEQANLQKKQSLLRQKSLINDELLNEVKERMDKAEEEDKAKIAAEEQVTKETKPEAEKLTEKPKGRRRAAQMSTLVTRRDRNRIRNLIMFGNDEPDEDDKESDTDSSSTHSVVEPSYPTNKTEPSTSGVNTKTRGSSESSDVRPVSEKSALDKKNKPQPLRKISRSKSRACSVM